jgi:hypothetical protein
MRRIQTAAVATLALLGLSHCTTEACGCTPAFVPAVVVGQVLGGLNTPVQGARVRAYSAAGTNCHSTDTDFGSVITGPDGSFEMGLSAYDLRDSVCVFVFARPPVGASGLENSDTALLVMDFRGEQTLDSAQVELVLRNIP